MRAVCIDDEKLALDFMTHLLKDIEQVEISATFQHAYDGLAYVLDENIDVVFLDIHMPEIDGLELAEKILEKKPHIDIVFVTAYNEYAVNAFELNAIDYLLKPVKLDRLKKTIERIESERSLRKAPIAKPHKLSIRLGHHVSFSTDNRSFTPLKWRTSKARELFLYLLQNRNTLVHKGTLMEMLWNDDELDRGYSILYTTVYNVRKAIQPYQNYLELHNTNDGYMLKLTNVSVDLHKWEKQIKLLPDEINNETITTFISTMNLNSGPYLAEYDYIWIESEKQRLENMWIACTRKIVDFYIRTENHEEAIDWLQKITHRVPELEEGHLLLMKIHAEQKNNHLVTKQYDEYVTVQQSFGLRPSPKVRKWFTDYIERV